MSAKYKQHPYGGRDGKACWCGKARTWWRHLAPRKPLR